MQKLFLILGIAFIVLAIAWPYLGKIGLFRLPGDIMIKKENFSFYFPLTTMLIISIIVSVILWLFKR